MRKAIFFILAFHVLTAGQSLAELMKVVNLLDHFRMHMKSGEVRDLGEFILLHYFDPEHERSDPNRHQHLPLQQVTPHLTSVFSQAVEFVSIPTLEYAQMDMPMVSSAAYLPQTHPMSVFQPPRA